MPNWTQNDLVITGPRAELKKFKEEAVLAEVRNDKGELDYRGSDLSLDKIIPMPEELDNTTSPSRPETKEEKKKSKELIKKYGTDNWYDWKVMNWGTKWDVEAHLDSSSDADKLVYSFDSAWSPPIEWLRAASEKYPKLKFVLEYEEPGMCFSGTATAEHGEVEDDFREGDCQQYEE